MAGVARLKKFFFIFVGLSILTIIVYKSRYFTFSDLSTISYNNELIDHGSANMIYSPKVEMNENHDENLNNLKKEDLKTTTFEMNNLKHNMTDTHFTDKSTEHFTSEPEMRDWHDYEAMKADFLKIGLGEHGERAFPEKDQFGKADAAINESYFNFGINCFLSDQISSSRSIPDLRPEICKSTKYLAKMPNVSVVIPFKDECFSVLVRTVHSIINRSPPELLAEIILIDDNSSLENLKENLDKYVEEFFPKVKLVRLPETNGLIRARLVGAQLATSEILVILDAHMEVEYNWLPPLIDPIVLNNKACTLPIIDKIVAETFTVLPSDSFRGGINWKLNYLRLPLLSQNDETLPHVNPVMLGGAFAITAKFFWELGGYDNGLQIWGGEQYELSFKIWMCGGTMIDIPCSRVAHAGQVKQPLRYKSMKGVVIFMNYMRIAEVWMDDYKKYVYDNIPQQHRNLSIGDISEQKMIRDKLQCKSFEWYLKEIAFDSLKAMNMTD